MIDIVFDRELKLFDELQGLIYIILNTHFRS